MAPASSAARSCADRRRINLPQLAPPGTNVAVPVSTRFEAIHKCSQEEGDPMRSLIGTYLSIGIILLVLGFFATGACPDKNKDVVSHAVFVLGWPVYLYDDV